MDTSDDASIGLRLSLLESLTLGSLLQSSQHNTRSLLPPNNTNQTLLLRSQQAQSQFQESISKYRPIVQFVEDYKDNKPYLQPSLLLGGDSQKATGITEIDSAASGAGGGNSTDKTEPGITEKGISPSFLTTQSIITLLLESESDLRQFERDLRLCENFHERSTAGAGKLADHESLVSRLESLKENAQKCHNEENEVETQILYLMERYGSQVDGISKLFIEYDEALSQVERSLTRMERSHW